MKIPKTPIEFDYDLWTTEEGKCMVRIKCSGEQCEVSREAFRALRLEEKKIRRSYGKGATAGHTDENGAGASVLSLDAMLNGDVKTPSWLIDPHDHIEAAETAMLMESFRLTLTENQLRVFEQCMIGDKSLSEYARANSVDFSSVKEIRDAVRKKFKKFV